MATRAQNGWNIYRRGSSGVVPRNHLQERHGTVQRKKHVSLKYSFIRFPMLKVPLSIRPNGKAKFLRQSVTLTAFGNPVFDKPIENIAAIFAIFKRAVGDNIFESAAYSMYEGFPAIDVSNRYFTPRGGADVEDIRPLTEEVDPNGYLAKAAGSTYVHTEENKVYYFEKAGNGKGWGTKSCRGSSCWRQTASKRLDRRSFNSATLSKSKFRSLLYLCEARNGRLVRYWEALVFLKGDSPRWEQNTISGTKPDNDTGSLREELDKNGNTCREGQTNPQKEGRIYRGRGIDYTCETSRDGGKREYGNGRGKREE